MKKTLCTLLLLALLVPAAQSMPAQADAVFVAPAPESLLAPPAPAGPADLPAPSGPPSPEYTYVSIYDIQYTENPGSGGTYPSPYEGQTVKTSGVVVRVYPSYYTGAYVIMDPAGGPWNGLMVFDRCRKPAVGEFVELVGKVEEYYGFTQLSSVILLTPTAVVDLPEPLVVPTARLATANVPEDLEGVLVAVQMATVTAGCNQYNEWKVQDSGGGPAAIVDDAGYLFCPPVGTVIEALTGTLWYSFNDYKIEPGSAGDILVWDNVPPAVASTVPPPGAANFSPYAELHANFSEKIKPATLDWTLEGPAGAVPGDVTYDDATARATFIPHDFLSPTSRYTATIAGALQDLRGNEMGADYAWSFTTGPADTTPPWVVSTFPVPGATGVSIYAAIVITFSEDMNPATLDTSTIQVLKHNVQPVAGTVTYNPATFRATFAPQGLLDEDTPYRAVVKGAVTDRAGNPMGADYAWNWRTGVAPPMYAYHGDLHNHTSYSDGSGTPAQAFGRAREYGMDFFAVTDHSYAINDAEWLDTWAQAEAISEDGVFIGLRGFEYTQGGEGHINVYNTVRHAVRQFVDNCAYCDYTPNLEAGVTVQGFYPWLAITGTHGMDAAGTVMQFNHPGWMNFNDWTYHPEVEDVAQLSEVGNGWGSSYFFAYDEWIRALDYGWKVGATNNTDNHTDQWATIAPNRTGVIMPELTKVALLDALRARRTFATEDANFQLFFKANNYWLGSEIPYSEKIVFEIWGHDPEITDTVALVQLITTQGQVVAESAPHTHEFQWTYALDGLAPGAHYFFVLLTQADGDRIVSSPVWVEAAEDIRLTDLTIQPVLPTIYNPSLLTARVTNRGLATQTVTVTFALDGVPLYQEQVTLGPCQVGPCPDAYAVASWQPVATGPVTVTAALEGVPAGDNPGDNSRSLVMHVSDERIPLVLIDVGHNNVGVDPRGVRMFVNDLTRHGYNVLFNLDELTPADLNTETVKVLIINAYGPDPLTITETQAVADFVAAGGSLWLNGMADYPNKIWWAHNLAPRMNALVDAIEGRVGAEIPIRFNDDEVLDGNNNNGYPWGILWHIYPMSTTTGVGVNVNQVQAWSVCSLVNRDLEALTPADLGENGFIMVQGDLDPGRGTFNRENRTHNIDGEGSCYPTNDAYIYISPTVVPAAAGYILPEPAGRLFFYGDSNDPFNVFAYVVGDGKQNELFNLQVLMWLLGEPLQPIPIAEARAGGNEPLLLNRLVWVEGYVTASFGEFFDVLYVQDDTAGITIFAPAGTAAGTEGQAVRGDCVRVVGTVDIYQGDTEIQFFEAEQVRVLTASCVFSPSLGVTGSIPLPMSTYQAGLEESEGWLVVVTGTVLQKQGSDTIWIDDGSGPLRLFLDGYNGDWSDVQVGHYLRVAGLASEDYFGPRIRVRNHGRHPDRPDDVVFLEPPRPELVAAWPPAGAAAVPLTEAVVITFSRPIATASFTLAALPDPGGWAATWSHYDTVVHMTHAPLAYSTTYTLTVTAEDTLGQPLEPGWAPNPWSFTTMARPAHWYIYLPVVFK